MAAVEREVRSAHPYLMHEQIHSQADAVASVIERERAHCAALAERLRPRRRIYIVGIGTSWHAALVGAAILRSGPEAFAVNSFEFCADAPPVGADDAVIILSHRGTKQASFDALDAARERGALTIAVASTEPGPRITAADELIHTIPPETSAAYTVSYTTALTALAMLDAALAGEPDALDDLPDLIRRTLETESDAQRVVERHAQRRRFVFAGWGAERATAYEAALKIKETSRASCEGFQIEQLLHGPFCEMDADCLLTIIASHAPDRGRAVDLTRAAQALGAPVWAICPDQSSALSDADALSSAGADILQIPAAPPRLQPILSVIPLQLFTYHLALARKKNPDLFQLDDPSQAAAFQQYSL